MLKRIRKLWFVPVFTAICLLLTTPDACEAFFFMSPAKFHAVIFLAIMIMVISIALVILFLRALILYLSKISKTKRFSRAESAEEEIRFIGDEDVNTYFGWKTPLMWAVEHCLNPEALRTLIEKGANVNAVDIVGNTPLMLAVRHNENPEIFQILIEKGANVNAVKENGYSPLMLAARYNIDPKVHQTLIEKGANVNAANRNGNTPLMLAARYNENPEIFQILIEKGANVNAVDRDGRKALDYAKQNEALNVTEVLNLLRR